MKFIEVRVCPGPSRSTGSLMQKVEMERVKLRFFFFNNIKQKMDGTKKEMSQLSHLPITELGYFWSATKNLFFQAK
jgi:hypothetical protein